MSEIMQAPSNHRLEVPEVLRSFTAPAVNRLGYLHPNWTLRIEASIITVEVTDAVSEEIVAREIHYALYREKILADTMDMRRDLLRMVSRS